MLEAAAVAAVPKILPAQVAPAAQTADEAAGRDIADQAAVLNDRTTTSAKREEAARRLVSRSSPEADSVLLATLKDHTNREGQTAVARALASDPTPQPTFVPILTELLGSGAVLTDAVAQALVTYKGNEEVRATLVNYATKPTTPLESRAGILLAMGKMVDKQAAGSLINLINTDDNARIR